MNNLKRILLTAFTVPSLLVPALAVSVVHAETNTGTPTTTRNSDNVATDSTESTKLTANEATRLANMKTKGNAEISRRLATLSKLSSKISSATKLSGSDKAALTVQVNIETIALTALKAKLASETTLAAAINDVQAMVYDYRVYALLMPKIHLIRTADDQQVVQGKLTDLAAKLQTRITAAQTAGKNVTTLQTDLAQLQAQIALAKTISVNVETKVLALASTDYNTDHTVLNSYVTQLKTAHQDNQAAFQLAKTIVTGLKNL